ncbi:hypothetical protein H311_00871 [Anncaliia algerae PRA109]|nr:hypothetical protein H311_00871 [Anncaliia algerae PRA109]
MARKEKNRNIMMLICTWKACKAKRTLWSNTIFERFKTDPTKVLSVVRLCFEGYKMIEIKELMDISGSIIINILSTVREKTVEKYYSDLEQIGGDDIIVEVDEAKFGKRKYYRGHRVEKVWVFDVVEGIVEKKSVSIVVENRSTGTLLFLMKKYIKKDSIIFGDCWRGYARIREYFHRHFTVNHSLSFVDLSRQLIQIILRELEGIKMNVPRRHRTKIFIPFY